MNWVAVRRRRRLAVGLIPIWTGRVVAVGGWVVVGLRVVRMRGIRRKHVVATVRGAAVARRAFTDSPVAVVAIVDVLVPPVTPVITSTAAFATIILLVTHIHTTTTLTLTLTALPLGPLTLLPLRTLTLKLTLTLTLCSLGPLPFLALLLAFFPLAFALGDLTAALLVQPLSVLVRVPVVCSEPARLVNDEARLVLDVREVGRDLAHAGSGIFRLAGLVDAAFVAFVALGRGRICCAHAETRGLGLLLFLLNQVLVKSTLALGDIGIGAIGLCCLCWGGCRGSTRSRRG